MTEHLTFKASKHSFAMLAIITGCTVLGIHGWLIQVEVDVATGLPTFSTVGLPDSSVRESKDRVKAAIKNCGYQFPNKRITVNRSGSANLHKPLSGKSATKKALKWA